MTYSTPSTRVYSDLLSSCTVFALTLGIFAPLTTSSSAQALSFKFDFASDLSSEMTTGLNVAAENWAGLLTDDVTINLQVSQTSQISGLASFNPTRVSVSYREFYGQLTDDDVLSPDDEVASAFLPKSNDFDLLLNPEFDLLLNKTSNHPSGEAGDPTPYVDDDGDCNNRLIRLTSANAKAIGLPSSGTNNCATEPETVVSDGTLSFNSNLLWDFDPSDGIDSGHYDFVGVATQGLGVMLGGISGVDVLDFNTSLPTDSSDRFFDDRVLSFVSPIDLFRFSTDSLSLSSTSGSQSLIDWTTGRTDAQGQEVDKYFSIDGGQTKIASFSTGVRFGDGYRASGWKADNLTGTYLGIFEPSPAAEQRLFITENDRRLMDVIGWDLDPAFWPSNPGSGGNPPPSNGNPPPPPPSGGNPPPSNGNPPPPNVKPPNSAAIPEAGHGLGAAVLVAIALGRWVMGRSRKLRQ